MQSPETPALATLVGDPAPVRGSAIQALVSARRTLLLTLVLLAMAIGQVAYTTARLGTLHTSARWQLVLATGVLGAGMVAYLLRATWRPDHAGGVRWLDTLARLAPRSAGLSLALFVLLGLVFPFVILSPAGGYLDSLPMRLCLFWLLAVPGAGLLYSAIPNLGWEPALAAALLVYGTVHLAGTYLPLLSTYPLALDWSETSRFYYGSLFLSGRIYGTQAPLSVLHPSRYLLQAIPFLIPQTPLWFHRLWQVALWLGLTLASAYLLARRLSLASRWQTWLAALWAFLFLFQGPVLYHLLISVVLVLWGYDSRRLWKTLLVVLAASAWAGISRVNWIPVPAMLASALYFLETPVKPGSSLRYLLRPLLWGAAGSLTALGSQALYMRLSGNEPEQFSSSFQSDLLWYRLFPSQTYALGVLPALALATAPILLLAWLYLRGRLWDYHPFRLLSLGGLGFLLLAAGTVVSAKIGGGSNLHNLDSLLILLAIVGAYLYFDRIAPDGSGAPSRQPLPWSLNALLLLIPLTFTLSAGRPMRALDHDRAYQAIEELREHVARARQGGGEIVFVSQRHLITFGQIEDVPLVPEYEKVFLMEMALSGNQNYLGALEQDLAQHRFSLIVIHPQRIQYQGRAHVFGEENDAWVRHVSTPMLCYYEPLTRFEGLPIQLLVPRVAPGDCA